MAPSDNDEREPSRDTSGERGDSRDDNDELATRSLRIQSKRYYVDVKQNKRGRFVKLVEGLPNGDKNRLSFQMSTISQVRDKLNFFADYYSKMEPNSQDSEKDPDNRNNSIKSDKIQAGQRSIYFDLKENKRGVYLRISCTAQYGTKRHTIALPAQGIVDIRNVLTEFYEEFGQDDAGLQEELPDGKELRIERKRFFFDCGSNDRGSFLRISEVTSRYRSSITLPKEGLTDFRDCLDDMIAKMDA